VLLLSKALELAEGADERPYDVFTFELENSASCMVCSDCIALHIASSSINSKKINAAPNMREPSSRVIM
jgi:hypothetical protein